MKPEPSVYNKIYPLPPNWRKNRKKGIPEVYTAYCSGCGATLPLKRDEGIAGTDETNRPFVNQCLFCGVDANLQRTKEAV